jgi:hypothetical protein
MTTSMMSDRPKRRMLFSPDSRMCRVAIVLDFMARAPELLAGVMVGLLQQSADALGALLFSH